jgi:hypothetical protein
MDGKRQTAAQPTTVHQIKCSSCAASIPIRVLGQTSVVVCQSCRSVLDVNDPGLKVIDKMKRLSKPIIALGTRGTFRGVKWEAVGYMVRTDGSGVYSWQEYLLFNPQQGFRWLVQNNGHWSFVKSLKHKPEHDLGMTVEFMGTTYKKFLQGQAKVAEVQGEFYWKVQTGDTVQVWDYVNPPTMLSREKSSDENIWSVGEYVEANDVATAFTVTEGMPPKVGIAPNQPIEGAGLAKDLLKACVVFVIAAMAIQVTIRSSPQKRIHSSVHAFPVTGTETYKTDGFEIEKGPTEVAISLASSVSNNWLEIEGDLVNDESGLEIPFNIGVERYSGVSEGEAWSEGSGINDSKVSSVPKGRYHLEFNGKAGAVQPISMEVGVTQGVGIWSNFFILILPIVLFPVGLGWWVRRKEVERWSESDYSPYVSEDDEDDEEEA